MDSCDNIKHINSINRFCYTDAHSILVFSFQNENILIVHYSLFIIHYLLNVFLFFFNFAE
jgi:hypothetical protein